MLEPLADQLTELFGPRQLIAGLWGYSARWTWPGGAFLAFDDGRNGDDARPWCTLELQGGVLEGFTGPELLSLLAYLHALRMKTTRIDTSYDDYGRTIEPWPTLFQIANIQGDVAGYRNVWIFAGGRVREHPAGTVYFGDRGSKGSGRYGRVYDKHKQTRGKVDAIRWEVEWSDERARVVFKALANCASPAELAAAVGRFVGGAFDFPKRDGSTDRNLARFERHEWWTRIRDEIGACPALVYRPAVTVERTKDWLESMGTALARVRLYLREKGRSYERWLDDTTEAGDAKLSTLQRAAVAREALAG